MLERNEESQIRSVEDSLLRRFEGRVPRTTVQSEVAATFQSFRDARIRTYVPVLVQREATNRLRHVAPKFGEASAA